MALDIVSLWGPQRGSFLMSEAPLYRRIRAGALAVEARAEVAILPPQVLPLRVLVSQVSGSGFENMFRVPDFGYTGEPRQ